MYLIVLNYWPLTRKEGQSMYYIKNEKGYWLPSAYGYTNDKSEAGLFSLADMANLSIDGCTLELAHQYNDTPA